MPQLSERREDIPIFAEYFLELANKQLDKQVLGFTPETMAVFQKYNWPGNLRELSNVIKRATLLTQGGLYSISHFTNYAYLLKRMW